jgi:hypothetical protein
MSYPEYETFEKRRKRFIREHENDLNKELRRQGIWHPKTDYARIKAREKSHDSLRFERYVVADTNPPSLTKGG